MKLFCSVGLAVLYFAIKTATCVIHTSLINGAIRGQLKLPNKHHMY